MVVSIQNHVLLLLWQDLFIQQTVISETVEFQGVVLTGCLAVFLHSCINSMILLYLHIIIDEVVQLL